MASAGSTQAPRDSVPRGAATLTAIFGFVQAGGGVLSDAPIPTLGLGHFIQRDWLTGATYLGAEVGLMALHSKLEDRIGSPELLKYPCVSNGSFFRSNSYSPLSDFYFQSADLTHLTLVNVYLIEIFSTYRSFHERASSTNKIRMETSVPSLMLSPFKPRYLLNPWVVVPPILTGAMMYLISKNDHTIYSAKEITLLNTRSAPNQTARLFAAVNAFQYLMVASGEEMFFRGVLQTEFAEQTNPTIGLVASSVLFGLFHIPNHDLNRGFAASLIGLYLGYLYSSSGYDLGAPIAFHFWWDFTVTLVPFIMDPRNTPLVYSITWKL